jgi:hypothetical protein
MLWCVVQQLHTCICLLCTPSVRQHTREPILKSPSVDRAPVGLSKYSCHRMSCKYPASIHVCVWFWNSLEYESLSIYACMSECMHSSPTYEYLHPCAQVQLHTFHRLMRIPVKQFRSIRTRQARGRLATARFKHTQHTYKHTHTCMCVFVHTGKASHRWFSHDTAARSQGCAPRCDAVSQASGENRHSGRP